MCELAADPLGDGLERDIDATLGKQVFNVTQAPDGAYRKNCTQLQVKFTCLGAGIADNPQRSCLLGRQAQRHSGRHRQLPFDGGEDGH